MQTLTIKEAAAAAGVSRRTIHNWIADDKVQYLRNPGGAVRILPASLLKPGNVSPEAAQ